MWLRVALIRTNVSEEGIASIIKVKRISELGNEQYLETQLSCEETVSAFLHILIQLLVTDNVITSFLILFALMI
jgi:hypothetical protein